MEEFANFREYFVAKWWLLLRMPFRFSLPNFMRFWLWDSRFLPVSFCLVQWFQACVRVQKGHGNLFYITKEILGCVNQLSKNLVLYHPNFACLIVFFDIECYCLKRKDSFFDIVIYYIWWINMWYLLNIWFCLEEKKMGILCYISIFFLFLFII